MNKMSFKPIPLLLLFMLFLLGMDSTVGVSEDSAFVHGSYTSEKHLSLEKGQSPNILVAQVDVENEEYEEMDAAEGIPSIAFVLLKQSVNHSILLHAKTTSNPKFNIPIF